MIYSISQHRNSMWVFLFVCFFSLGKNDNHRFYSGWEKSMEAEFANEVHGKTGWI